MSDATTTNAVPPLQPLTVYVLWHPASNEGALIAGELFKCWQGDSAGAGYPRPGIPVFFISNPPAGQVLPEAADPYAASQVALVILVDDVLVDDATWHDFLCEQALLSKLHSHMRVFLVQLCARALTFHPYLSESNFIRLPDGGLSHKTTWIINRLNHALCRMLPSTVRRAEQASAQVRIFISHAKADGLSVAKRIRNYIYDKSQLNAFFDAHDIPYGDNWAETLEQSLGATEIVLLAIQTDQYATRVSCRREVLWAKKNEVPIVVLNAVASSEVRGFPYLGNSPTLRWRQARYEDVLGALLNEVLRARYFPLRLRYLSNLAGRQMPEYLVFHPELLTLAHQERHVDPAVSVRTIVHPEPPLGVEETDLLRLVREDLQFTTPSAL